MSAQRSVRRVSLRPCPGEEADRTRPPSRARWRTALSSTSHPCTTPAHRCWGARLEKRGRHSSATRESFSPVWCLSARLTSQRLQRTASTRWWSAVRIWSWSSSRRMPGGCNMRALEVSKQYLTLYVQPKNTEEIRENVRWWQQRGGRGLNWSCITLGALFVLDCLVKGNKLFAANEFHCHVYLTSCYQHDKHWHDRPIDVWQV